MPALGIVLVGGVAATLALRGSLRVATIALLATTLLVPDILRLPHAPSRLPISRLVLYAFAVGLLIRIRHGELSIDVLRPRRVQGAFVAFLLAAFVLGVIGAPSPATVSGSLSLWLNFLDQLVLLTVVLAAARALGPTRIVRDLAVVAVLAALVAVWEHFSHDSYARFWFRHTPDLRRTQAVPLELRGQSVRVRASAQYALEFGWMETMLLPAVIVAALASWWRSALVAPAILAVAVLWSQTRSSLAGMVVVVVVLALLGRADRRVVVLLAAAAVAAVAVYVAIPGVRQPYQAAQHSDSADARTRRLIVLTTDVAERPYNGIGLNGLDVRGYAGADSTYLLLYASVGVIGLAAFGLLLLAALATTLLAAWRAPPRHRLVVAACAAGVVGGVAGASAFDQFSPPASAWIFWLLVALATATLPEPDRGPRSWLPAARVAAPVAGVLIGILFAAVAPTHTAASYRFETLQEPLLSEARYQNEGFVGRVLIHTACSAAGLANARGPRAKLECTDIRAGQGIGEMRLESGSRRRLDQALVATRTAAAGVVRGFRAHRLSGAVTGRPTWARTAPAWLGVLALGGALLCPPRRRPPRRRPNGGAPSDDARPRAPEVLAAR